MSSSRDQRNDGSSSSYPPPPVTSSRLYIARKAREILATRDVTGITKLVKNLCYAKESEESSKLLYGSFKKHFPNLLAVKLLQAYRFSTTTTTRTTLSSRSSVPSYSLKLLNSLLIDLEGYNIGLKTEALKDMKKHLNACLLQQEISDREFKLLSRITSRVSVDFFIESLPWDELSRFISSLNDKKMLLMFGDLPMLLDEDFLKPLLEKKLDVKIVKGLFDQDSDDEKWCLALEAGFNLMLQLINLERKDLVWDSVYVIVNSVWEMVNVRRREVVVRKGLMRLVKKVRREAMRFREPEYVFVSRLVLMIKRVNGIGEQTQIAAKIIHDVLERYYMEGQGLNWDFIQSQFGINSA